MALLAGREIALSRTSPDFTPCGSQQLQADGMYRGTIGDATRSPVERYVLARVRGEPFATIASLISGADGLNAQLGDRLQNEGLLMVARSGRRHGRPLDAGGACALARRAYTQHH
jgi:hypothetical protein